MKPIPLRRIAILAALLLFLPLEGKAVEISRPHLMSLARQFVDKVGQKLPPSPTNNSKTNPESAQGNNTVNKIPENELLLLTPRLSNSITVDATIGAFQKNGTLFIAFQEFCQGMQFPIIFSNETKSATGWYIRENSPFKMDLAAGTVQSRTDQFIVTGTEWFSENGVIYISAESIRKWMHIDYTVNIESQLLDLAADVPFPLEDRIKRQKWRATKNDIPMVAQLPRAPNPPQLISIPNTQVSLGTNYTKMGINPTGKQSATANISTSGDVLGHTTRTQVGLKTPEGLNFVRLKGERRSETPDLLGPLHAKSYEIGDISPVEQLLTGSSSEEWGMRASNADDNERVGSISRTLEGDIPPGWDVELYNENQLIALQTSSESGRYRFEDIDLYAGDNDFRLVFYGPQGEVREENVNIPVNLESVGENKGLYDISLTLNNIHTYDKEPDMNEDRGMPHFTVSYEKGINDGLTVGAGLQNKQSNGINKTLASGNVIARIGATLLNATLVTDEELETALQVVMRRSFGEHDIRSTTLFATNHFSPDATDTTVTTFRSTSDLQGPLFEFFGQKIKYSFNSNYSINADDMTTNTMNFNQNARIGVYTIGHALRHSIKTSSDGLNTTETSSTFSLNRSLGATRMRASARYIFEPTSEFDLLTLSLSRNFNDDLQGQLDFEQSLASKLTTGTARLNWGHKNFVLSPNMSINSDKDIRAGINLRFGLVHNPFTGDTKMTPDLVNNQGSVTSRVFLDKNGNNIFDTGDEPIEGAAIKSVQSVKYGLTDSNGIATITDLPEFHATDITLENATLGDPYYISTFKGKSVYPRPGTTVKIDFPVHLSGELDGTVSKSLAQGPGVVGGVHIQLINNRGEQAFSTLTAYDGYYVISMIPPGTYLLRVDPKDLKDTGFRQRLPQLITISHDGKIIAGQNIQLDQGTEIPIQFTILDQKPDVTSGPNDHLPSREIAPILLSFGSYKSSLLSALMSYRIRRALAPAGLWPLDLTGEAIEKTKNTEKILTARIAANDYDRAQAICNIVIQHKINCGITMAPSLFFKIGANIPTEPKISQELTAQPLPSESASVAMATPGQGL